MALFQIATARLIVIATQPLIGRRLSIKHLCNVYNTIIIKSTVIVKLSDIYQDKTFLLTNATYQKHYQTFREFV